MSDLINRQDAIEALTEANLKRHMDSVEGGQENRSAIRIIMELPSVEPEVLACGEGELSAETERKKGKWIDETFKPWGLVYHPYRCDQCGDHADSTYDYCPNCGADMRGK